MILLKDRVTMLSTLGITGKVCMEVGVFWGKYSEAIFAQRPSKLFLIDPWKHQDFSVYPENSNQSNDQFERMYESAVTKYGKQPSIKIIRDYSSKVVQTFEHESLDFIYIDANHSYPTVMEDFGNWWPKVKKGGWFCGHDLTNPNVIKALKTFLGSLDSLDYTTKVDESRSSSWAKRR